MVRLRSIIYFLYLCVTVVLYGLPLSTVGWLLPMSWRQAIGNAWGMANIRGLRVICDLKVEITGLEHLATAPSIIMSKHQSAWETIALRGLIPGDQVWVLKRELMWVPFFGWAMAAVHPIAINRKAGRQALKRIVEIGSERLAKGATVVIFPEGTRVAPGERGRYGIGGGMLAEATQVPVVPVAHNAGVFWQRRGLRKHPGTVRLVVGEPMDISGLSAAQITRKVEGWIETEVAKLPSTID